MTGDGNFGKKLSVNRNRISLHIIVGKRNDIRMGNTGNKRNRAHALRYRVRAQSWGCCLSGQILLNCYLVSVGGIVATQGDDIDAWSKVGGVFAACIGYGGYAYAS